MMNLWILTEERPKVEVLQMIFELFAKDQRCGFFGDPIRIIPILNPDKTFAFTYEVIGFKCAKVNRVFIKTVSGSSYGHENEMYKYNIEGKGVRECMSVS